MTMGTSGDSQRKDRVVVEVRVVFKDNSEPESQFFTWPDVEAGAVPEIGLQDWTRCDPNTNRASEREAPRSPASRCSPAYASATTCFAMGPRATWRPRSRT